jgi:hypothetical protein
MNKIKNITLEMSLKPFKDTSDGYIENVCKTFFTQWYSLIKHTEAISVLLWSSDGSEILEYTGEPDDEIEWAKYIGGANPREKWDIKRDPEKIGLHNTYYLYNDSPPVITYRTLKNIIFIIKKVGYEITQKSIRVGATFDPGPEFAKSEFKYTNHNECCNGNTMGVKSFVSCYSKLNSDNIKYAGFPNGIPQNTPFGTFFGIQCKHFLKDLDFDYLWLSNGFGFGIETWGTTGALFNGKEFNCAISNKVRNYILEFWKSFRKECPDIRIETRGTNLSTGIDLSTDSVSLRDIYNGDFNIMPPPNSPWGALDGDFGLELVGYMSRIAELPDEDYMFRFYVHDPWWMTSPWIDRYQGYPHDIYLPLSIARVNMCGEICNPASINFLTIDNSLGNMPDRCPNEIIPHIMNAYEHLPDKMSPFVWIYPFDEYHDKVFDIKQSIEEVFFGDWFIKGAINNGLPINTVISTKNFKNLYTTQPNLFNGSVLITPVPENNSEIEKSIIGIVESGGKVILYGSLKKASASLLKILNIKIESPVSEILHITINDKIIDEIVDGDYANKIYHSELLSDGGICESIDNKDFQTHVIASVKKDNVTRTVAVYRNISEINKGKIAWIRGTNSNSYVDGDYLLKTHDPEKYFISEILMRYALDCFGYSICFKNKTLSAKSPITMVSRFNNSYIFSGYVPDTTVSIRLRFPYGAPIMLNHETRISNHHSVYNMPRAWRSECRVFVKQEKESVISCIEYPPVSYIMHRRIQIKGLKNAEIRYYVEKDYENKTEILLNTEYPHIVGDSVKYELEKDDTGIYLVAYNITGTLLISR